MVVSNQTNRVSVVGAGAVLAIPYPFPTVASGDLKVIERIIATGVPTELTEGASSDGYTATYGTGGGTVTTSDSIPSTAQVHVIRDTDMTQPLDLVQGGDFSAPNVEAAFDKSVKLVIENADQLTRTLKFPDTDPSSSFADMPTSIDRASKNLTFDSAGKPTASSSCLTGSVSFTTIGTNIAEAANATAVRTLLELGWFDARAAISSGAGTSVDPWLLSDVSANVNVFFPVAGYYKLTANWNIVSNGHIWGTKGVFLDPDTYTFECSGTVSGTTTDLTADGAKGAMSVTVGDESSFSADDWIEISASKDVYFEWDTSGRTLPRELNQVVTTTANTLNLKYPLRREYDYDGGFADNPTVTLITTLKENIVIENINIQGDIDFGYVNNLAIRGITVEMLSFSDVIKSFEITNVETDLPVGNTDEFGIRLDAASEGLISVRTYGGKYGVRMSGCAEITGNVIVKQCDSRAVWIYGCDDIHLSPVHITGTRTSTDNIETLLFDNSGFCSVRNAFIKESGKTGDWSVVEFRAVRDWCEFTDSEVFGYTTTLVTLKPERIYAAIDRNKFYLVSDVVSVCSFDSGIAAVSDSVVKIRDNEVIDAGDTGHMLRAKTAFTLTVDDIKHVEVSGNKMPVGPNFLIRLSAAPGNAKGIETLVVTNNTVEVLTAGIGVGGIYGGPDLDFPVRTLIYNGNTEVQNAGLVDDFAQVTNLITVDHTVTRIVCNENQSVCNENVIVEN